MKFTDQHDFAISPDGLMKTYARRDFFEQKYAALGAKNIEVLDLRHTATEFSIQVRFDIPTDAPVPDFAKKFMPETSTITQRDTWNLAARTGRIEAEIKGAPVKISAEMKVVASSKGAQNQMNWEVKCSIPLVGGKLEDIIAKDIKAKSARDAAISSTLLLS